MWEAEAILDPTDEEISEQIIRRSQQKMSFEAGRYWVEMPGIENGIDPN